MVFSEAIIVVGPIIVVDLWTVVERVMKIELVELAGTIIVSEPAIVVKAVSSIEVVTTDGSLENVFVCPVLEVDPGVVSLCSVAVVLSLCFETVRLVAVESEVVDVVDSVEVVDSVDPFERSEQ